MHSQILAPVVALVRLVSAARSFARFDAPRNVGVKTSINMPMIRITIMSSNSVKPSSSGKAARAPRCARRMS